MINHVYTLLVNDVNPGSYQPWEIPVDPSYTAVVVPAPLSTAGAFILNGTSRVQKAAAAVRYLSIAKTSVDLWAAVIAPDPRYVKQAGDTRVSVPPSFDVGQIATEVDPSVVFRPNLNTIETSLYNVWTTSVLYGERAAAVAIAYSRRIDDLRTS